MLSIAKGETSAAETARKHGLTIAEIERWKEQFFAAGENALRARPKPDQAGIGAVPFQRAKAALERRRPAPAVSPTSLAAERGPQPGIVSSKGARRQTIVVISCSRSLARSVSSRQRMTSSRAMPATVPSWPQRRSSSSTSAR